jgi:CRP/FNR family cyclic AMP-dependent transcriptional regulator
VAFELATRLLSGLEGMSRKLEFALQGSAIARLAEALLTLAYRFGENSLGVNAEVTIELELTHQQLAEMTGLNRETVTRHLMMLRHQGLIEVDKHHYRIPNLSALEKLVLMPIEE